MQTTNLEPQTAQCVLAPVPRSALQGDGIKRLSGLWSDVSVWNTREMAALTQHRCLAGTKAFVGLQKQTQSKISNGSKYFMRRHDSYMVEVNVADTETEDQAVRRYMRAVVQSGVLNKLRARRTKETKIEQYKRKLAERAQARKLGIEEPTWEDFYGENVEEAKPFDEFFTKPSGDEDDSFMLAGGFNGDLPILDNGYYEGPMYELDSYNYNQAGSNQSYQGGYINNRNDQGGYINQGYQGGYINQPDQGGYISQGYEQQQQQQVVQFTAEQLQQQQPQQ